MMRRRNRCGPHGFSCLLGFELVEELDLKDSYFESKSIQFHWSDSIEVFISAVSIVDAQSVSS